MPPLHIRRPCTLILRSAGEEEDGGGNMIPVEVQVDTVCSLQQDQRAERGDAGEISESRSSLYLLPEETFNTGDGAVVDGKLYEAIGEPERVFNERTGTYAHIEATVRLVGGTDDDEEGS